jgi:hypothetical protein
MPQDYFNTTAVVSGSVVGIIVAGLTTGLIEYSFIVWLLINIAWWSSVAFAAGFSFALGAYVTIYSTDRIDNLL